MEIVTTKERFLQKKDSFKAELCSLNNCNDKEGLKDCIQTCLGDVFGEEYKDQFSESEVHILNSLLKTIGVDAKLFINETSPKGNPGTAQKTNPLGNKNNIGALAGLGVGIVLAALFIHGSKPLLCALTIGAATIFGGILTSEKSQKATIVSATSLIDVDKVVGEIEAICEKVDSFMNVCSTQIKKISK